MSTVTYRNNPKYWDRQAFANNVDPDQMLLNVASNQDLPVFAIQQQYFKQVNM